MTTRIDPGIRQQIEQVLSDAGETFQRNASAMAVAEAQAIVTRRAPLSWRARNFARYYWRGWWRAELATFIARRTHLPVMIGSLHARVIHADGSITDYGEISRRVVTTAGVNFIVDAFQNLTEVENFKYHAFGTGTNAEAAGDTALQTELTTEYATDNTRPTGTQTEGASANIYRTVGTLDPDSAVAVTEHGVMSQAAVAGGTLLDRSVFSAINLSATGATLEITYELTLPGGS